MAENTKSSTFVVDASFILSALLPDEHAAKTDIVFEKFASGKITLQSSFLLPFEVLNGLKIAILRKRITSKQARVLAKSFLGWDILLEKVEFLKVLALSLKEDITVYDASYLWLAQKEKIRLFTLDKNLASKMKKV